MIPDTDPTATIRVAGILPLEEMQPILDAFAAEHPTITVKYDESPFENLASVLQTRITSKTGDPDIYWANMPDIAAQVNRGYAADITDQFQGLTDSFSTSTLEATTVDGRLFGLPIANSTQLLFYNKTLLDAAGVEYPSADPENRSTWEDIAAGAKKAIAAGAPNGFLFEQQNYYQFEPLPVQLGGSVGATDEGNLTPDLTGKAWVDSMSWLGSLYKDGISPKGIPSNQYGALFQGGSLAYFVGGPWNLPALNSQTETQWGVAAQPVFEGGKPVTPTGSWALSINAFSKEKPAAAIFLKFMAVEDGYIKYRPSPELPATTTAEPLYFDRDVFKTDEGKKAEKIIAYETANTAVNRVGTIGYIEFDKILTDAYADIVNGGDAAEVLQKAQDDLTTAWAVYKE